MRCWKSFVLLGLVGWFSGVEKTDAHEFCVRSTPNHLPTMTTCQTIAKVRVKRGKGETRVVMELVKVLHAYVSGQWEWLFTVEVAATDKTLEMARGKLRRNFVIVGEENLRPTSEDFGYTQSGSMEIQMGPPKDLDPWRSVKQGKKTSFCVDFLNGYGPARCSSVRSVERDEESETVRIELETPVDLNTYGGWSEERTVQKFEARNLPLSGAEVIQKFLHRGLHMTVDYSSVGIQGTSPRAFFQGIALRLRFPYRIQLAFSKPAKLFPRGPENEKRNVSEISFGKGEGNRVVLWAERPIEAFYSALLPKDEPGLRKSRTIVVPMDIFLLQKLLAKKSFLIQFRYDGFHESRVCSCFPIDRETEPNSVCDAFLTGRYFLCGALEFLRMTIP